MLGMIASMPQPAASRVLVSVARCYGGSTKPWATNGHIGATATHPSRFLSERST